MITEKKTAHEIIDDVVERLEHRFNCEINLINQSSFEGVEMFNFKMGKEYLSGELNKIIVNELSFWKSVCRFFHIYKKQTNEILFVLYVFDGE